MKKTILVDSACDLKNIENIADGISYHRIPLKILVGDKEFVDDEALNAVQMMEEVYAYPGKTSSACPGPEDWAQYFREADESYVITITSNLSGSYNSAMVAKEMVLEEYPDKKIYILDSLSAGAEMVLQARKMYELVAQGTPFEEVCKIMDDYAVNHTRIVFMLYSIENLVKNGRVSRIAGMAAGLLNLHMIGRATEEGTIASFGKARNKKKGAAIALEEMEREGYRGGKVVIGNCGNPVGSDMMKEAIMDKYGDVEFEFLELGGLCSYYAERNGLMIGYEVN